MQQFAFDYKSGWCDATRLVCLQPHSMKATVRASYAERGRQSLITSASFSVFKLDKQRTWPDAEKIQS